MQNENHVIEALCNSKIYQDYARSFTDATGLPVTLRPVESWQLPHHSRRGENPFCAAMATKSRACASCLQVQQELAETCRDEARSVTCQIGMCDTAVPVKLGEQLVAFLHTGQIFRKRPTEAQFDRVAKLLSDWGVQGDEKKLKADYFSTRVLSQREHEAVVNLLKIFAQHLSLMSNQIVVQQQNAEPPVIARAKDFIKQHQTEDISLGQVAKAVNTSTFYLQDVQEADRPALH